MFDLAGSVASLNPRDDVADADRLAFDAHDLAGEAAGPLDPPALDDGVAGKRLARSVTACVPSGKRTCKDKGVVSLCAGTRQSTS